MPEILKHKPLPEGLLPQLIFCVLLKQVSEAEGVAAKIFGIYRQDLRIYQMDPTLMYSRLAFRCVWQASA